MSSIIKIVKGTTEVSLLDASGFNLLRHGWDMNSAEGSNVVRERISCKLTTTDPDDAATQFQTLNSLLNDAVLYSKNDPIQNVPVYIETQYEDETNKRYALIAGDYARFKVSPYDYIAKTHHVFQSIDLVITREHPWHSHKPGILPGRIQLDAIDGPALDYDETDFDVDLLSTFGHKPSTMSGGIIGRPGKFGGGVQVAEATTNLITNPSFEVDTAGWATGGANTIAVSTAQVKYGSKSMKCTYQNNYQFAWDSVTLTAVAHVCGVWVYIPSDYDGTDLSIRFIDFAGATGLVNGEADMTKTDQWQFILAKATPDAGDLVGILRIAAHSGGVPSAGKFIYIDAAQCEAKAYPTPYCDGSLGPGHSWSGAAHGSTSSRVATDLEYALTAESAFSIVGWWKPRTLETEPSSDLYIFDWYNNANDRIALRYDNAADDLDADVIVDSSSNTVTYSTALVRNTNIHFCLTWDGSTFILYINGSSVGTPTTEAGSWGTAPSTLYIGADNGDSNHANGTLDDFFILDRAMSADEVSDLYGSGKAFAGDPNLFFYLPFDGPQQNIIANYRDDVPLTHIYRYDASVPAFSANLIADREHTILPDPVGQNDLAYFGSTDNPFHHIAHHLKAGGAITTSTLSLEYWKAAGWTAMTIGTDYSLYPGETLEEMLEGTGLALINVHVAAQDWATTAINGVTAYWIRIKEGHAIPVYATDPIHIGPAVYLAETNELRIPSTSLHGDAAPLALLRLRSPGGGIDTCSMGRISRIIWGIKSQGLDGFTSNLNAGNQDNPSGWAVTYGADTSSSAGNWSPGGYSAGCTFATTDALSVRVTLTGTNKLQYWLGRYRIILKCRQTGGTAGQVSVRLRTFIGGTAAEDPHVDSKTFALTGIAVGIEALDMGELNIPFAGYQGVDDFSSTDLIFQIFASRVPASGTTLRIWELVLIPIDQASGTINDTVGTVPGSAFALLGNQAIDHDKGVIRRGTRKVVISGTDQQSSMIWDSGGAFIEIDHLDDDSRIYFLMLHYPTGGTWGTGPLIASPGCALIAELYLNHGYEIFRGND